MATMGMGMGQATMAEQAGMRQAPPEPDDEQSNVSPEEQAAYDQFVSNGMEIIYPGEGEEKVAPSILESLQASGEPIQDLAMTAASLITGLIENAANAGHKLDPEIVYQGGVELIEQLADVAEAAKIHDYSDKEMESALYNAADQIIKTNPGGIIDQQAAGQDFEAIVEADRDGSLEQAVPQIGQYARSAGGEEQR